MAATPRFKVYIGDEYVAAFKYPEHAAVLCASGVGRDSTIRDGHAKIVWNEGHEEQFAAESYDFVAETVYSRMGNQA